MNGELESKLYQTAAGHLWKKITVRPHHGIVIPLFSLHSENSTGIGEFLDLIPMIHWCKSLGMDVIQLLPLNDIGLQTSPYNALSAFALSPIHLSMTALPSIEKVADFQEKLAKIRYWNRTSRVKYHIVRELKNSFFREYFSIVFNEISETPSYLAFFERNKKWIEPFSLFKALKEKELWRGWEEWPEHLQNLSPSFYAQLLEENKEACQFHQFLQYLCFEQMENVKKVAEENNILIKGDIPILIAQDSSDVWHFRQFFLPNLVAGAPPDMYSKEGQYWGFPVFNWEEMEKSGYEWWKERLEVASHLYHLYRIDHVVGFFRLWVIAKQKSAKEGTFLPPNAHEWIPHGRKIMEMMLMNSSILPIGEDLGLVPPEVKYCLYDLGICGTKMMRWERRWDEDGGFIPCNQYQPTTMTTVSTHDSDTLQLWWRHFPKDAKLYSEFKNWDYRPFLSMERHKEILWESHHSTSLFHINLLQEYLALFPELVAKNPSDERINIPGKILETNWTYRFRPSVEQIIEHVPLRQAILDIIK